MTYLSGVAPGAIHTVRQVLQQRLTVVPKVAAPKPIVSSVPKVAPPTVVRPVLRLPLVPSLPSPFKPSLTPAKPKLPFKTVAAPAPVVVSGGASGGGAVLAAGGDGTSSPLEMVAEGEPGAGLSMLSGVPMPIMLAVAGIAVLLLFTRNKRG